MRVLRAIVEVTAAPMSDREQELALGHAEALQPVSAHLDASKNLTVDTVI
jgi:hypothetical protein